MSIYVNKKIHRGVIIVIAIGVGALYPLLNKDDNNSLLALCNGLIIGCAGGLFIAWIELVWNPERIRKLSFLNLLMFKTLLYTSFFAAVVPLVITFDRAIFNEDGFLNFYKEGGLSYFLFHEDYSLIILYALAGTAVFIFTYQMSRKLGQGMLWVLISGKYYKPKEVDMVFMFLDLKDSTPIAERIGDMLFSNLLKDVFFDITESIVSNYGKIYRYVGDEVVVYWPTKRYLGKVDFIKTFFDARRALSLRDSYYQGKYGLIPKFTASFHMGRVVLGEIGEIKSQMCFIGNAIPEAAAIQKQCKIYNASVLVSEQLFDKANLPDQYAVRKEGVFIREEKLHFNLISVEEK